MSSTAKGRDASAPPTASLSRERIVRTAVEIIDEGGLAACTVRAVAVRLDCSPMALYRHFEDKEELLNHVPETLLEPVCIDVVRRRKARTALRAVAEGLVLTLRSHPGTGPLFANPVVGENMAAASEHCVRLLISEGHSPDRAFPILRAVVAQAIGEAITHSDEIQSIGIELILSGIERPRPS